MPRFPRSLSLLQISGYASDSNHVFAPLISMPPEFSQMPLFKSINFIRFRIRLKIRYFCKKKKYKVFECWGSVRPQTLNGVRGASRHWRQPIPKMQISSYASDTQRELLIQPSFKILNEKLLNYSNRYLQ